MIPALDTPKRCGCGEVYREIPRYARLSDGTEDALHGWLWECACRSTLFVAKRVRPEDCSHSDMDHGICVDCDENRNERLTASSGYAREARR
jgi:hypothetical protein